MKRGEVWWVSFDPTMGGEVQKTRPSVIVSNDKSNEYLPIVQVVPLTSQVTKGYPGEAIITLNKKRVKAMANQIRTVSVKRVGKKMGELTLQDMMAVEHAMRVQLGIK